VHSKIYYSKNAKKHLQFEIRNGGSRTYQHIVPNALILVAPNLLHLLDAKATME
jgi:hypothetical protein